jgi:hypothetical protein
MDKSSERWSVKRVNVPHKLNKEKLVDVAISYIIAWQLWNDLRGQTS